MVGYAGSPICTVHDDMTLTRSKVKVNVRAMTTDPLWGLLLFLSKTLPAIQCILYFGIC